MTELPHSPEQSERARRLTRLKQLGGLAMRHTFAEVEKLLHRERIIFTDAWWERARAKADLLMQQRRANTDGRILLVATAQHPLKNGREPGEEFTARLEALAVRAHELKAAGRNVVTYIPGSRHTYKGVADHIALADAGTIFLQSTGLPHVTELHGSDLNEQYKGDLGVYNSGDEAFVASRFFYDEQNLRDIEVFCSPGQAERWELHAIASGVVPTMHTVMPTSGESYHGNTAGQQKLLTYTRRYDPTWQDPTSIMGNITRLERRP